MLPTVLSFILFHEETKIDDVYEDWSDITSSNKKTMTESVYQDFTIRGHNWLLKYDVCRESDSTLVEVSADFKSRYSFSDKAKLEVTVKAVDKTITEKFDLKQESDQIFNVDLIENGFPEVEKEDIKVICLVMITEFKYIDEYRGTTAIFNSHCRPHDVVLVVGEKKFYVQKVYLATWSKYFNNLFYGEFAEKDKKEINIEDVDSTEFGTLMKIIHPDRKKVDGSNVLYLLKLAGFFDMPSVMAKCGKYLLKSNDVDGFKNCPSLSLMDRLELSDKYKLSYLQRACSIRIHKRPATEVLSFMDENRRKIRKLSKGTVDNLV